MEFTFERGERRSPRGHALLYFRDTADPTRLLATYLIVPPVSLDLARYVPPMMAASIPLSQLRSVAALPLPPIPEQVESAEWLRIQAETRDDDLLDGGALSSTQLDALVTAVAEAAQRYHTLYLERDVTVPPEEPPRELDVDALLRSLMSEHERIGELAKLVGKLRYAIDGNDAWLAGETVKEMERLTSDLPEKYRIPELIAAARQPGERGFRMVHLYIERCYKLASEEYAGLDDLDRRIRDAENA